MKRILLGSTAMLAIGFVAVPAMAQLNMTVSGYYRFDAAYVDESGDGTFGGATITTRDYDFASRARLSFDVRGTADNGLKYGARIRFNQFFGTNNLFNQYDDAYAFIEGGFGQVILGDVESAGTLLRIYAPDNAGTGSANGTWMNFARGNQDPAHNNFPAGFTISAVGIANDSADDVVTGSTNNSSYSTKIVYTTTGLNLAGFTFGLSYAPEIGNRGRNYDRNAATGVAQGPFTFEDAISVAVNYTNENLFGGVGLKAAAQYNAANSRNVNVEDLSSWMIGAQISYAGFTVGGHYIDNGDSGSATGVGINGTTGVAAFNALMGSGVSHSDYQNWGAGAEYAVGPWTFGVNYFASYVGGIQSSVTAPLAVTSPITSYTLQAYGAGVSYLVAPGLTVGGDITYYYEEFGQRANALRVDENDGTIIAVRTQVDF